MTDHVLVCGLGRFGLCVVEQLRTRGTEVTVISGEGTHGNRLSAATALGAHIMIGDIRNDSIRSQVDIQHLSAVILATADDAANLEVGLEVRAKFPHVRVVMRATNHHIAARLEQDFGIYRVMAPALVAAPIFAKAILEHPAVVQRTRPHRRHRKRFYIAPRRREIATLGLLLTAIIIIAMLVFRHYLKLSWLDSAYFTTTTITTVGFGDFNLRGAPPEAKVAGIVLMASGVLIIAVFSSLFTNWLLSGGVRVSSNMVAVSRLRGHIVICGHGALGKAVALELVKGGSSVVAIDINPAECADVGVPYPVLVGDATLHNSLIQAGLDRAVALIATTPIDAINVEIGLNAQSLLDEWDEELHPSALSTELVTVLRCFDADIASRLTAASTRYIIVSDAKVAAPVFADAALAQESLMES